MTKPRIEVDSDELMKKLRELDDAIVGDALVSAVQGGGYVIETKAKILVPVDTGHLRDTISTSARRLDKTKAEAETGASAHYAPYVELGTTRNSAQPFLEPALSRNQSEIISAVAKVFASQIMKVAR